MQHAQETIFGLDDSQQYYFEFKVMPLPLATICRHRSGLLAGDSLVGIDFRAGYWPDVCDWFCKQRLHVRSDDVRSFAWLGILLTESMMTPQM